MYKGKIVIKNWIVISMIWMLVAAGSCDTYGSSVGNTQVTAEIVADGETDVPETVPPANSKPEKRKDNVKTGDDRDPEGYLLIFTISSAGIAGVLLYKKYEEEIRI